MKLKSLMCAVLVAGASLKSFAQSCTLQAAVSPLNYTAVQGETVQFTANISGVGPFNVYWANEKGQPLSELVGDNRTIAISNVNASDAGLIYVVVYDLSTGCGTVTAGKLFVRPPGQARGFGNSHLKPEKE